MRMGSLRFLPQTSCPEVSGVQGPTFPSVWPPLPTLPTPQPPALESYLSSRDSEGFSSSLSLLLGRLLGRRGRFCKGHIWGLGVGPQELQNQGGFVNGGWCGHPIWG